MRRQSHYKNVILPLSPKPVAVGGRLPLVSVLIPAYNAAGTIAETLDSVRRQTYPNIETIVVDDGSTDETAAVLARHRHVRVVTTTHRGLAAARNTALALARGEYLALLDADDICDPERLRLQVAYLEAQPDVVLCSSDFSAFGHSGPVARSYIAKYYGIVGNAKGGVRSLYGTAETLTVDSDRSGIPTYSGDVYETLVAGNFIHPPTVLFRRSIVATVGEFDNQLQYVCDWDWLTRVGRAGRIGFIDRPLLKYRLSASQWSGRRNRPNEAREIIRVYERLSVTNPQLYQRRRAEFRRHVGSCYLRIAGTYADTQLGASLANLWTSVRYAGVRFGTLKVFARSLLPRQVLGWLRLALGSRIVMDLFWLWETLEEPIALLV